VIWLLAVAAVLVVFVWLGRRGAKAGGDWRAAAAVLSAAAGVGAVAAASRGAYVTAGVLVGLAAFVLAAGRRRGAGVLSDQEARTLLGVGPEATPEEIRAAHRVLIRTAHPDQGGSAELAARLNAARDRLLRR
jgi:hypothetical protein